MRHVERQGKPARRLLPGVPGERGEDERGSSGEERGRQRNELRHRALTLSGRSRKSAMKAASPKSPTTSSSSR